MIGRAVVTFGWVPYIHTRVVMRNLVSVSGGTGLSNLLGRGGIPINL